VFAVVLADGTPHRFADGLWIKRACCADCGTSWPLRPSFLYPHRSLEPDVAEAAALAYLSEAGATYAQVAADHRQGRGEAARETLPGTYLGVVLAGHGTSDHLAVYPAALEHEARLSQAALRDERVRALLAFAAANVGDVTACRRFIAGTEGHHAAAAWALLACLALARSDLSEAETCLAAARRLEPSLLPELVTLAADTSRRKAEAAARRAEAILQRWPESTSSRKVQRHVEAKQCAREAEALRRRGEEGYAAAQFDHAAAHWRLAAALGAEGLGARIAEASSRAEARLQHQRIQAVEAALSAPASPESLSSYLALDPSERQITTWPRLSWTAPLPPSPRMTKI
jgi:hypothetical protein